MGVLCCLFASAQEADVKKKKGYEKVALTGTEIDFLFSYYEQDGNNSAVTGGRGTEQLTDATPSIVINLPFRSDSIKNNLTLDFGLDVYTSASSDSIDPRTISSASSGDTRAHFNGTWSSSNEATGHAWNVSGSVSAEYDYSSVGFGGGYTKTSKNGNREFGASGQVFIDRWSIIYPIELRGQIEKNGSEPRNSYSMTLHYSQVVNKRFQWALISDLVYQTGWLSTPFHRVYFSDVETVDIERLPDTKLKIPIGFRANYFLGDFLVLRSYYRYYQDDWDLRAHTLNFELPVKVTPFLSFYPFYRYYTQSSIKYFAPFAENLSTSEFYTSDFDLAEFDSHFYGLGMRYAPVNGLVRFNNLITETRGNWEQ